MERIKITFTYDVDTDTGEITLVNKEIDKSDIKKSSSSTTRKTTKSKTDDDPTPKLILSENKYQLNQAAVELMSVEPEDRIDIKYEKDGKSYIPVIGSDANFGTKGGNRLTKSLTVACRGKANDELSRFGTEFIISPHPSKEGLFILTGNKDIIEDNAIDENIEINADEIGDIDLTDIVKNEEDTDEINSFDFTL